MTVRIHVKQLPCAEQEFRQKFTEYLQAREAHKETVGVPAPMPEYEVFRTIADVGAELEIYEDPKPEVPEPTPPTYADLRRDEYNRRGATIEALTVALFEHVGGHSEGLVALAKIRDEVKAKFPKDAP